MAPYMLHPVHVPHEGLGEVGQIPSAEIAQGEFPQPFRQPQTGGFDFTVYQTVGSPVLLQMGHKGQQDEPDCQRHRQRRPQQGSSVRQGIHEGSHQKIQDTHAAHDHQIGNDSPERAASGIFQTLIGQGVFALEFFAEHFARPFLTSCWRSSTGPPDCNPPTFWNTAHRQQSTHRGYPVPPCAHDQGR